jgi:hypothetical protein
MHPKVLKGHGSGINIQTAQNLKELEGLLETNREFQGNGIKIPTDPH